jgi:HK97 family phage portal protein
MGLMKILDRAMGITSEKEEEMGSRLLPSLRPGYNDGRVSRPTDLFDIFRTFKEDPPVYTAISAIGKSIADIPFVLIEAEQAAGERQFRTARDFMKASQLKTYAGLTEKWASIEGGKIVRHHPLLSILERPSQTSQVTGHLMKQAMVAYLELTGTAYIEKLYSAKDSSTLAGLWPLIDPRKMMVIAGEKQLIDGYVYTGPKGMVVFKPEDMIFMRTFAPDNPFYGYSPTQVLRVVIGGDLKALNWNFLFFENGARPDGMLVADHRLNSSDIDLILDTWDDSHQGEDAWHRPAVMGQGMKWVDVGSNHKDMDFPNLRRYSKEEILGAYGVPPIVAGDYKDANRASSDIMYRLYYENAILPRCDLIEDSLNMALLEPGSGLRLVFDLGAIEALKGDLLNLAKVGARIRNQGWSTNELRWLLWGLPIITDNPNANMIFDETGKIEIGHAPVPTELTQRTPARGGG